MTRFKQILLASALVPSLTMIGLAPGFPQASDQPDHHPRRQHEGDQGGDKRSHNEKREDRGTRGAANDEHRSRNQGDDDDRRRHRKAGDADRGDQKAGGDEDHRGRRKAGDADRGDQKVGGDEDHRGRRKAGDADRGDQKAGGDEGHRGHRKDGDADRGDQKAGDEDRRGHREAGDADRGDRKAGGDEDRRGRRKAGDADRRDQRKLGDEDRGDQRKLGDDERHDPRKLGGQERRDERPLGNGERRGTPGGTGGLGGGFLPPTDARRVDDLRRDRREVREGDRTFIREPGRTIVEERGRSFIVHDEVDRFRALGLDVRRERRGDDFVETARRPNGDVIVTITDASGRMLRRLRRGPDGREIVLIDNGVDGRIRPYAEDVVVLPPPPRRVARDRYIVDYGAATPALLYETLIAPPLAPLPRRYTLDQIRYSPDIRSYVRQIDINTINFDTGSWEVPHSADGKLDALANAIGKAIDRNPNSVFLIEGYTDATGNPTDNLSLSDRRAQSVAEILTKDFKIPPENLTTQGYGQQNPVENTQGSSAANRRVVVRNITQLLASGGAPAEH